MSTLKRCSGYRRQAHEVPIGEFSGDTTHPTGLSRYCSECHREAARTFAKTRARHPVTGQLKSSWKDVYARSFGAKRGTPEWKSLLDKGEVAWNKEIKTHLLDTAPAAKVLEHMKKSKKPKFNQGRYKSPLARAVAKSKVKQNPGFAREGPGFVYVYEDEMKMPGLLKIGSTQYSNGRLASANTWGAFTCLYEKEFERRYEAEDMVHDMLDYCRIYSDKEWFRVTLTVAIEAIGEVRIDIRKKQKMG